jgi:hypothetical protein
MQDLDEIEETFPCARPDELREPFSGMISRIVLHFTCGLGGSPRTSRFCHREIHPRP